MMVFVLIFTQLLSICKRVRIVIFVFMVSAWCPNIIINMARFLNEKELEELVNLSDEGEEVSEVEDCDDVMDSEHEDDDDSSDSDNIDNLSTSPDDSSTTMLSKDSKISWRSQPCSNNSRRTQENIINMTPGPTRYATSKIVDIKSSFDLFINPQITKIILQMSNMEGNRIYGDEWKTLKIMDLQAYFGLLLLAGVYKSNGEATSSLWNEERGRAIFRATMPLKKFHIISRVLRFDNRSDRAERRETDKLAAIRDIWDKWVEILPKLYNPGDCVTVDEQLVGFRGRCPFRQYLPSKPAKYGIKIWAACDSKSSYAWNMQVYTGKLPGGKPEKNQGLRVVMDLTHGLKGHNVTCDNFFTSYQLAQMLLKRRVTMVGTIRKNKTELPRSLTITTKIPKYTSRFAFTDKVSIVSYTPNKNRVVTLMSTMHNDNKVSEEVHKKPEIILYYNSTKGAVDTLDKLVATYTCKRMTNRWPIVIFSNMLDISAYNAYVLWTHINPEWNGKKLNKRRIFLEELGSQLIQEYIQNRTHLPRNEVSMNIVKQIQFPQYIDPEASGTVKEEGNKKKRKRCNFCINNDRKTTATCGNCNNYICKEHTSKVLCQNCV